MKLKLVKKFQRGGKTAAQREFDARIAQAYKDKGVYDPNAMTLTIDGGSPVKVSYNPEDSRNGAYAPSMYDLKQMTQGYNYVDQGNPEVIDNPWEAAQAQAARGSKYYGNNSVYNTTPRVGDARAVMGYADRGLYAAPGGFSFVPAALDAYENGEEYADGKRSGASAAARSLTGAALSAASAAAGKGLPRVLKHLKPSDLYPEKFAQAVDAITAATTVTPFFVIPSAFVAGSRNSWNNLKSNEIQQKANIL